MVGDMNMVGESPVMTHQSRRASWSIRSIYMVSGTRDNPPFEIPSQRQLWAPFFTKFNQLITLWSQTRLGGRDNFLASAGSVKQENFSSNKRFSSPNRDNSRRGECHVMPTFRILSENELGKTHCDRMTEAQRKRDIYTFDYSVRVINNHALGSQLQVGSISADLSCLVCVPNSGWWSSLAYRVYVFIYKRSIKLPRGPGLGGGLSRVRGLKFSPVSRDLLFSRDHWVKLLRHQVLRQTDQTRNSDL